MNASKGGLTSSHPEFVDVSERIVVLRGHRILLDSDLASLYGVTTGALNQAMKRNKSRFPPDFLLYLTESEWDSLRSQTVILKTGRGRHRKFLPVGYTEHGAIMAATILSSTRAVRMSVFVVRAFVELRRVTASNAAFVRRLEVLERSVATLDADTRRQFDAVFEAILNLMGPFAQKR